MAEKLYMSAEEVADAMGISLSYAYKVVRELNAELKAKGFMERVLGGTYVQNLIGDERRRRESRFIPNGVIVR